MTTQAELNAYFQQLQGLGSNQVMMIGNIPMRYTAQGMMPDPEWVRMTGELDTRPAGDGYHNPPNWANEIQQAGGALNLSQAQQQRGYPGATPGNTAPGQRSGVQGTGNPGGTSPGTITERGLGVIGERGLLGGSPADPNRSMGPSRMPYQPPSRSMGPGMVGNPNYIPPPSPPSPPGGSPPPNPVNPPNPGGNPPGNPPGSVTPPNPVAPGLLGTAPRQWTGSPWQAGPNSPFSGSFFPAFGVQGVANYQYPAQPGGTVTRTPGSGGLQPTGTNPGSSPPGGNPPSPDPVNGSLQSLNTSTPNTSYTPRNLVNYAAGGVQLPYRNQFEQYTQSLAMAQPWTPTYNGRGQSGTPLRGQPSWQQGGGQQGGGMNLGAMLAGLLGGRNG